MPGEDIFILLLLFGTFWTFIDRGVDGERVNGVVHGRVEFRGRYGHCADWDKVEWFKYSATNSSRKLKYLFKKPNNSSCIKPCKNIEFTLQNMSLILVNLTPEDEGIYEEKTTFKNNTIKYYNFTLSLLFASNISVSSNGSLTLECKTYGEFKLLRWFRNKVLLPDDERFSLSENNKTLQVTNLTSSYYGTYTCQVSNGNAKSEVHVNVDISGEIHEAHEPSLLKKLLPVGYSIISLLVLFIILICICKHYECRKMEAAPLEEPVYNEPTFSQEERIAPSVDPLLIVYQDFIKPKDSHGSDHSDDFGYSTIPDVLQLSECT